MPQLILSFVYNIINKEQGFAIIIRKQNKNDQKTHWLVILMQKKNNNKIAFAWIFFLAPALRKLGEQSQQQDGYHKEMSTEVLTQN